MEVAVKQLERTEEAPWDLLLSADPSERIVKDYLERGTCYIASIANEVAGEFVLLRTRPETVELINIAVDLKYQGRGIGKKLVMTAVEIAKSLDFRTIEVGTGNSGISQLALYQKCGFRIVGVDHDFFVRHYSEAIYENGIRCRDMIRLSMDL